MQQNRISLHKHHQNTPKPRFMTIPVFKWNNCGLTKCLSDYQSQNPHLGYKKNLIRQQFTLHRLVLLCNCIEPFIQGRP